MVPTVKWAFGVVFCSMAMTEKGRVLSTSGLSICLRTVLHRPKKFPCIGVVLHVDRIKGQRRLTTTENPVMTTNFSLGILRPHP